MIGSWKYYWNQDHSLTLLNVNIRSIAKNIGCIEIVYAKFVKWCKANKLSVNASRAKYMTQGTFHSTNKYTYESVDDDSLTDSGFTNGEINVILDDVSLERVNFMKFLCVIINENLTWKNHLDAIF